MKSKTTLQLNLIFHSILIVSIVLLACSKKSDTTPTTPVTTTIPDVYKKIYGALSMTSDGTTLTITTNGLPDHKSVYYATSDAKYEAFSGKTFANYTFAKNPNTIATQSLTFKIPLKPAVNATHAATPLGPIGIAINGVVFFNQYAGPSVPLTNEMGGFDQYWGHPQNTGQYHYHVEPLYLTTVKTSKSSLLGFLLDGFPVYGPEENGAAVTTAMLDAYHGHTANTVDYPTGIYHYHITSSDPYINGSGFYGTPGTISK
jgi:hypothetical protein